MKNQNHCTTNVLAIGNFNAHEQKVINDFLDGGAIKYTNTMPAADFHGTIIINDTVPFRMVLDLEKNFKSCEFKQVALDSIYKNGFHTSKGYKIS